MVLPIYYCVTLPNGDYCNYCCTLLSSMKVTGYYNCSTLYILWDINTFVSSVLTVTESTKDMPITYLTIHSVFEEQYRKTAVKLAAMLTKGIMDGAIKPFEVRTYEGAQLAEAFHFLALEGENKYSKPRIVVEVCTFMHIKHSLYAYEGQYW